VAISIPIVATWDPKGLQKSVKDFQEAKGGWSKAGMAVEKSMLPAAAALGGIGLAAKSWITEAEGGRQASAALAQVFAQMGDKTGAAAAAAEDYASKLSAQIGVDDDVIKQTQTKLATFSALSGEVGRSSGMFDRATQAAHDLASAGFGDASSNAVQLGKALQDPSKGMAALAKSGITFTDAEKEKIKAMQKSGDLLGAQQIIMGAVETQVKGTAAASATSSDKIATSWGNVQEALGTALLPTVDSLAVKFQGMATWVQDNSTVVLILVGAIAALAAVVLAVNAAMRIYQTMQVIVTAAQWAWNAAMAANPVGLIILAIVALVAIFAVLWNKSEGFRNFFKGLWEGIKGAVGAVVDWFKTAIPAAWQWVKDKTAAVWNAIKGALSAVFNAIKSVVTSVWNGIKTAITVVWTVIKTVVTTYVNAVRTVITTVFNAVKSVVLGVWNAIKNAIKAAWDWIKGIFRSSPVQAAIDAFQRLKDKITGFMQTIKDKIGAAWDWVKGKLDAIKNGLSNIPFVGNLFKQLGAADGATISFLPGAEAVPTRRERAVTINVSGAVDQEGTARTLAAMLDNLDVRHSRPVARAVAW
jgi:phage-related protein